MIEVPLYGSHKYDSRVRGRVLRRVRYRDTSLIRNSPAPWDHHRTPVGIVLL